MYALSIASKEKTTRKDGEHTDDDNDDALRHLVRDDEERATPNKIEFTKPIEEENTRELETRKKDGTKGESHRHGHHHSRHHHHNDGGHRHRHHHHHRHYDTTDHGTSLQQQTTIKNDSPDRRRHNDLIRPELSQSGAEEPVVPNHLESSAKEEENSTEEPAVPHHLACPEGMIRRQPVPFSAIGNTTARQQANPSSFTLSTARACDAPLPSMGVKQVSKEPIAMAVTDDDQYGVADEENITPAIATETPANRLNLGNKRLLLCLSVVVLFIVCGSVAGIVAALVSTDDPPSPSLPFSPTPPLPSPTPIPEPIDYEFQQVGSSLFEETNVTASLPSGPRGEVYFGWAVDLSSDGQRLVVTSPYYSSVYIFDFQDDSWVKSAVIIDTEGGFVDHIALSGDSRVLAVGMPGNDDVHVFGGKVQVYEEASLGSWQKRGDPIFGQGVGHLIGGHIDSHWRYNDTNRTGDVIFKTESFDSSSLALSKSGNVLAIGSSSSNTVQVFGYNDSNEQWVVLKTFLGESARDKFGTSVDLSADGEKVIVGAPNNIGEADPYFEVYNGHVRVFRRLKNETWVQLGQDIDGIRGEDCAGEQSGSSVSISEDGTVIAVGANLLGCSEDVYGLGDHDGYVKVYKYDENSQEWRQLGNTINVFQFGLLGTDSDDIKALVAGLGSEKFPIVARLSGDGKRVALSVLAESLNDVSGRGVVRLYELRGEVWEIIAEPLEGTMTFDHSGRSIAISFDGSRLAVGSPEHNNVRSDDGQVRVFEVQGSTGDMNSTPTIAPSSSPTLDSTQATVPLFIALNVTTYDESDESGWLLECGGALVVNRTVIGSANVTETILVKDGGVCQLVFSRSWRVDLYTVYYGENDVSSPMIVNGTPADRDTVVFHVTPNAASVTIIIQPDIYISETTWSLYCEGQLFASVPLGELYGSDTYEETIMGIEEDSLCEFVITDAFGDGICCDGGVGFYRIYFGANTTVPGALLAEGGEFGLEERVGFVVAPGPTLAPTASPAPTTTPSPTRPVSFITIFVRFDEFPSETGWSLYCDDVLFASIPTGSYSYDLALQNVTETFLINEGAECRFTITDTGSDGMCCNFGEGFYRIYLGDNVQDGTLFVEGGEFQEMVEVVSFTIEDGQLKLM